jgi:hypothetical protein
MTDLNTFNQILNSKYFIWNYGLGFIPRKSLMENKDNWSFFRHKFILCMSEYLFNPKSQVNDPSMEFRLAKKLFVETFGEEIDCTNKNTNNLINTYIKMAFLLYRGEINWLEDKQKISIGVSKTKINKLFAEKIDPENSLRNIYDSRIRPDRYEKSVVQLEKEFDTNQIKRLKEISKFQLTNPILYDRLYKQIVEMKFKNIIKNIEDEKNIDEDIENYLLEITSPKERTEYTPFDYSEVFKIDNEGNPTNEQINYSEPDYDPNYYHQIYGIANPVIHDEDSLKAMEYTDTQINLRLFPYCFPRPTKQYPLEAHEEISRLFYSLRLTVNGQFVFRDNTATPKTQLRCSFTYRHHWIKFLYYMKQLEISFPNYEYFGAGKDSMRKANNDDNCWGCIEGKFRRIPIFENESYDPDYSETETTDKPINTDEMN